MSTVTDTTEPVSSNDQPQHVGIRELLTAPDFIGVRAALVRLLGNDANRAVLATRIYYRASELNRDAIYRGGYWWWRATYETIMAETGLGLNSVRGCVKWLETNGYLEVAKHRTGGIADHTGSYRLLTFTDDVLESTHQDVLESTHLPSIKKSKTSSVRKQEIATPIPADWAPTESHHQLAADRNLDVLYEASVFVLHAETHARTAVRWNAAFTMWLTKATPRQPGAVGAPPAEPYRHPRLLPAGWRDPMLGDPDEPR